jgi:hypothetical protein
MKKFTQVAYIAGPYSNNSNNKSIEENINVATCIAVELWNDGIVALCPHMNTAGFEKLTKLSNREFVDGDLLLVERCDMVILTPDWYVSKGAIREVARAIELDIPFYTWPNVPWRI